jgi:opine dehydrogenase
MTMAADLTLMGHTVALFQVPEFADSLTPIRELGGIKISGNTGSGKTGLVMPQGITTDPSKALAEAEIVMITSPVFGHEAIMNYISPYFEDGQLVVFNTGYWSSLRFQKLIKYTRKDVVLAETMLLPYLTFSDGPGAVKVHATKDKVFLSAMPASRTDWALEKAQVLYPQMEKVSNILEVNILNLNPIIHAPITLLNFGTIENIKGRAFYYYRDGATRRVCEVSEAVDLERVAVARAFGINALTMVEQMIALYGSSGAVGKSIYEVIKNNKADQEFAFDPVDILYEVAREDVPHGLTPLIDLANLAGVSIPTIRAISHLLTLATGEDYGSMRLTLDKLGLSGMGVEQILKYVETGEY